MSTVPFHTSAKDIPQVQLSHTPAAIGAAFEDPNLIASAGLVPLIALAEATGLADLVSAHVSVPTDKGERRPQDDEPGRGEVRGRGLDPGHVDPAPRRHGQGLRPLLGRVKLFV